MASNARISSNSATEYSKAASRPRDGDDGVWAEFDRRQRVPIAQVK